MYIAKAIAWAHPLRLFYRHHSALAFNSFIFIFYSISIRLYCKCKFVNIKLHSNCVEWPLKNHCIVFTVALRIHWFFAFLCGEYRKNCYITWFRCHSKYGKRRNQIAKTKHIFRCLPSLFIFVRFCLSKAFNNSNETKKKYVAPFLCN